MSLQQIRLEAGRVCYIRTQFKTIGMGGNWSNMQARLMNLLNIRSGEERNVALMLGHYFFMGAAMILAISSSMAFFFQAWDITAMPYVYLSIAVVVSSVIAIFLKLSERTALANFLILSLAFILFGTVILRIGLEVTTSRWLMFVLPIWAFTLLYLSVTAFWTLAGRLFDIRQGKRIFGLMNAGSWLAYVVIGPFTTPLVNSYGAKNLYTTVAVCVLLAILFLLTIIRSNPQVSALPERTRGKPAAPISMRSLFQKRYIVLIFLLIALWHIAYFFLDNVFYDRATLFFRDADSMAGFLGMFFGAAGLLGFVTDLFLTGRIISRFGLRAGLFVTPTLTTLCAAVIGLVGTLDSSQWVILFGAAVAGKFINEGIGFSLDQSTFAVINQPLEERERARVQTITEGMIRPLATGLAGGLLLVFNTFLKFDATHLAYGYLFIAGAWIAVGLLLIRAYSSALKEALYKRRFGENGIAVIDRAGSQLLKETLNSRHPQDVIYALDLLEQTGLDTVLQTNMELIQSVHPQVRLNVIQRIERLNLVEALPALWSWLKMESEPAVRQSIACALTSTRRRYAFLFDSPDLDIQRGAWIGLLRANHVKTFPIARERLVALAGSSSVSDRRTAAWMIGESRNPALAHILLPLITDPDQAVQLASLYAAGILKHASLWAGVIQALGQTGTRSAAYSALIAGGEAALDEVMHGINDHALPLPVRIRLVRICSKMKSPRVIHELKKVLNYPNASLRTRVLIALHTCRFISDKEFIPCIEEQIQSETQRAAWLLASLRDLTHSEETALLIRALQYDLRETRNRLFYLFSFLYDPITIRWALHAISREDPRRRAYAIEMMDSILSATHKSTFLPLLENYTEAELLEKLGASYKQELLLNEERILNITLSAHSLQFPWLLATAVQAAIQLRLPGSDQAVAALLNSDSTTAIRFVKHIETRSTMLSTFERVVILKSIALFSSTPDEALAELADLVEEIDVRAGQNVVEKGADGDSMYVIVRGRVAVLDDERLLTELGERAVFGELTFLDSAPRTATVRALEDTTLLCLARTPFYELMGDYVEVAMGTIQMLTRMLRTRTNDFAVLSRTRTQ